MFFETVGKLNETFFQTLFALSNIVISFFFSLFLVPISPKQGIAYAVCLGVNPASLTRKSHEYLRFPSLFLGFFCLASCILCVILGILVAKKRRSFAKMDQMALGANTKMDISLVDTRTSLCLSIFLAIIVLRILTDRFTKREPKSLKDGLDPIMFHISSMIMPAIVILVIPLVIYSRNDHLRHVVKNFFCEKIYVLC